MEGIDLFFQDFVSMKKEGRRMTKFRSLEVQEANSSHLKAEFFYEDNNDGQLSSQKICLKISVIKTNGIDWELLTFDDIKKNNHFGILIHVLS